MCIMKKILVLTNVYPASDMPKGYTPVVHYFVREWVKMWYDVRVINYDVNFPSFYYTVSRPFNSIIANRLGCVLKNKVTKSLSYSLDDVKVKRIAITKYIPHGLCTNKQIEKAFQNSLTYLQEERFSPDMIISHWANPCLQLMAMLKRQFKNSRCCYVAHGSNEIDVYKENCKTLLKTVDIVGCRSAYIKQKFVSKYGDSIPTFTCYSGIPEKYVDPSFHKEITKVKRFVYVGTLIKRKYPSAIIPAIAQSFSGENFELHYIGEGNEKTSIERIAQDYNVVDKVHLHGRIQRDQVVEMLDESDVFVMISKNEAFGLVYLEAMARGCITIASRREGFDGIIQDGVNGFLCEAGDSSELSSIISKIRSMCNDDIQRISKNAIKTACELTDKKAAKKYIDNVEKLIYNNS